MSPFHFSFRTCGVFPQVHYLKNKVPCRLHFLFHSRDFLKTPYLALGHHGLHHLYVWEWMIYNEGHFTLRTKYLLSSNSSSNQGTFLKLHIFHLVTMAYTTCMFGRDWCITKGTLLEERSTFSVVSSSIQEILLKPDNNIWTPLSTWFISLVSIHV
jgi:hypothetical protein